MANLPETQIGNNETKNDGEIRGFVVSSRCLEIEISAMIESLSLTERNGGAINRRINYCFPRVYSNGKEEENIGKLASGCFGNPA